MDCLTLHPWWVPPIVAQVKPLENRDWHPPEPKDGFLWVGLHAGLGGSCRKPQREAEIAFIVEHWPAGGTLEWPTGAVVGAMKIVDVVDKLHAGHIWMAEHAPWVSPADDARYAWIIGDVLLLPEPMPCKGHEKLWTPPRDIDYALERLVREVA